MSEFDPFALLKNVCSLRELAIARGCSERTIYNEIQDGRASPHVRFAKVTLFPLKYLPEADRAAVEKIVQSRRVDARTNRVFACLVPPPDAE